MNFLNMFKPTKRGATVQSMFWYALNHPEIPRDNWMILDASYETEPSFGQDPCVDDLLEDILQSGLNKTHLHFFQDSCWRPKSQGRAFCMVIYGNTASQNKIALGGWKSPHEKKWPPWPVVRLVSQSKRTPGCRKYKYETKNPRNLVGHLGTRFQQELELIRWLSYVCSSVVLIYLIPPSGSYHNGASHSFSLANAQTVWFGSECVARG